MKAAANQQWSDFYQFLLLSRIPYISEEKYGNVEPVCQKWNSLQSVVDRNNWTTSRAYPDRKKPTEISVIFVLA